jgi:BMFP domain-containing protein YqiC
MNSQQYNDLKARLAEMEARLAALEAKTEKPAKTLTLPKKADA